MSRYILVTGASSGIGQSITLALMNEGYHVLATVRNEDDAKRLRSKGRDKVIPLIMDVSDESSVTAASLKAKEIMGENPLVGIINNAGVAVSGPVLYVPMHEWKRQMDVNVLGVVCVTQYFFPLIRDALDREPQHPRRIINIGSVSGIFASPFVGPYAASKHALEAISDSLRRELYMYNVQVVLIQAGNIDTPIWEKTKQSPVYSGPEYDPILDNRDKMVDKQIAQTMPLNVIDALLLKVLTRKNVKVRYLVRKDKVKFNLIRRLPAKWVDRLMHKVLRAKSGGKPK